MAGFLWDGLGHEEFLSGVVWSRPTAGIVPVEANEEDINTNKVNPDTLYRRTGIRIAISKFIVANGTLFANRIQAVRSVILSLIQIDDVWIGVYAFKNRN